MVYKILVSIRDETVLLGKEQRRKSIKDEKHTKEKYVGNLKKETVWSVPARFLFCGSIKPSPQIELVRTVMGNNRVWGAEEWATIYGVKFTRRQIRVVEKFPWNQDILNSPCPFVRGKTVRETHFARLGLDKVNGVPLTTLEWQKLHPASGEPRFHSYAPSAWYSEQKFAKEPTCMFRWYLDLQDIIPGSESQTWKQQLTLVPAEYEVASVIRNISKDLQVYQKQGSYPNPNRYGRCTDTTSNGDRVSVGFGVLGGLTINNWRGDDPDPYLGLSVSRKFPS